MTERLQKLGAKDFRIQLQQATQEPLIDQVNGSIFGGIIGGIAGLCSYIMHYVISQ